MPADVSALSGVAHDGGAHIEAVSPRDLGDFPHDIAARREKKGAQREGEKLQARNSVIRTQRPGDFRLPSLRHNDRYLPAEVRCIVVAGTWGGVEVVFVRNVLIHDVLDDKLDAD